MCNVPHSYIVVSALLLQSTRVLWGVIKKKRPPFLFEKSRCSGFITRIHKYIILLSNKEKYSTYYLVREE